LEAVKATDSWKNPDGFAYTSQFHTMVKFERAHDQPTPSRVFRQTVSDFSRQSTTCKRRKIFDDDRDLLAPHADEEFWVTGRDSDYY